MKDRMTVAINRSFLKAPSRPDYARAVGRPAHALVPSDQYWNTHIEQLLSMWYAGLDTSQIALRCGISESECYNALAAVWDWVLQQRRRKEKAAPLLARPKGA